MRVLYLTMNRNRVSTTVPTEGWLRLLPSRGLEPVLVSREIGAFHQWAVAQGISAYQDRMPVPDKTRPWAFFKSMWQLSRIVRRHKIQLIHCNEQDIYPNGRCLARLCGLPVVVSVHFTMDSGYARWAFRGRRRPNRIFFVSRGNMAVCREAVEGVIPESRWRVLYNGLDLNSFRPQAERRERFPRRSLPAGIAGHRRGLRAETPQTDRAPLRGRFEDRRPLACGSWWRAGRFPGDEAYASRLIDDGRAMLGDRLVVLGHLEELRDFYNGLDVFVNTSQEEACSISVIESLACGCPVLGYPSRSVDDQIVPDGGEIVPQDSVDRLAGTLKQWLSDPASLQQRRLRARSHAERMFDIHNLASQLWGEYEEVLAEWPIASG